MAKARFDVLGKFDKPERNPGPLPLIVDWV
jgi:hypothetical protein